MEKRLLELKIEDLAQPKIILLLLYSITKTILKFEQI